jgi:superfamily I DNA/RNA helicase
MKRAINQFGKFVHIIESNKNDTYTCPICKETLTRKFGLVKQYFAHPEGKGNDCELKFKLLEKEEIDFSDESNDILIKEFYNKSFDNVSTELSDYKSEDGYYLTTEQKEIIKSQEDKIKVSALAGSAKTSTIYYYAKERPFKKILYLVYNKAMKQEAEKTFGKLSHVDIKTTHGLAYGYVGKFYKNKLSLSYGVIDIIKDLNLNWNNDMELAVKIDTMMKEYMLSEKETFNDIELFKDTNERDIIIQHCNKLWLLKKDYNNNIKVEHDFYMKLFQLSKKDLSDRYDIILLDESQDSNLMVLDIISNSKVKGIVIIGDEFQQLYGWRRATNIMPYFDGKEYTLTTSFRVSQNIANIANIIVKDITSKDINMKGFNKKQTIIESINKNKPFVCLCRTNSYIFAEVFDVISNNKKAKLFFEGGYNSYKFENIKDAYYFYQGHKVNNPLFNKFKDYNQMIEYAKSIEDLELLALDKMIYKYGSQIPKIIDGIKYNTTKTKEEANVIFSTIHRSKGQTYILPVYISDDHFDLENAFRKYYIDKEKGYEITKAYEEMCVIYVAITRCSGQIQLSDKIKNYLLLRYRFYNNLIK